MTQAIDIIRAALQHLRVVDAAAALDENDTADAIKSLNAMMRAWEADGISLGWSDVVAATDAMPTPPEADEAIGYNLAVRLGSRFGVMPGQDVVSLASSGVSLLRALVASSDYSRCSYGDLPAGNAQRTGSWREFLYR